MFKVWSQKYGVIADGLSLQDALLWAADIRYVHHIEVMVSPMSSVSLIKAA